MSAKVYSIVTENIIALLDKGVVPWRQPWTASGSGIATNAWDKPYRGINVFILAASRAAHGFRSNTWLTFKQVGERGGKVNEGSRSTLVVFWKPLKVEDREARSGFKTIPLLRYFNVFNLDQTTGVKLTKKQQAQVDAANTPVNPDAVNPIDDAEAIFATYLARDDAPSLTPDGDKAFYIPLLDTITLPPRESFHSIDDYYATAFHEAGHSTGHKSRLGRDGIMGFDHYGSGSYAAEELVAEFTSAFLCAESGIDNTQENSAAYIASWKRRLQDDPSLVVKAAGKAQKAAEYIMGVEPQYGKDEE